MQWGTAMLQEQPDLIFYTSLAISILYSFLENLEKMFVVTLVLGWISYKRRSDIRYYKTHEMHKNRPCLQNADECLSYPFVYSRNSLLFKIGAMQRNLSFNSGIFLFHSFNSNISFPPFLLSIHVFHVLHHFLLLVTVLYSLNVLFCVVQTRPPLIILQFI